MSDIRKVVGTAGKLKPLKPVIESWFKVLEQHCKRDEWEGNPWWFGERATLSTLAGGAYRLPRWLAIEEYATQKRRALGANRNVDKKKLHGYGRCDLYLSNGNNDFALEAKQAWQPIGSSGLNWDKAHRSMASAWEETGRLDKDEGGFRVACTFIVPSIPPRKAKDTEKLIEKWISECGWEKGRGWKRGKSIAALFFPKKARRMTTGHGRVFPGVALVLTLKEKANKRPKNTE